MNKRVKGPVVKTEPKGWLKLRSTKTPQTTATKSRGARAHDISGFELLQAWWRHHRDSCADSLARLLQTPLQSLLTWMVIAIAVVLPVSLYLGLKNIQQLGQGWQDSARMSVFLRQDAREAAIDRLFQTLKQNPEIAYIDRITPGSALAEFQRFSGLGNVLDNLNDNPLPTVFVVQPVVGMDHPEKLTALRQVIGDSGLVDHVQLDMGWLRRLHEILTLGQRIVLALAGLLSLGVLLVIANTLRLAIENRRDEIIVTKMVGGTDSFVRRPFLYTGFWYGLGGGLLAVILLLIIGYWLSTPAENLVNLYQSDHSLYRLNLGYIVILLTGSGALGWLGAWLAVSRHLQAMEPR